MSVDARALFELLPAVYRLRDAELAGREGDGLTPAEQVELAALEAASGLLDAVELRRLELLRTKRDEGPLQAMMALFAEQVAVLRENLDQLYDDQFIETCAPWVVPYIGDLIGYRTLHGKAPGAGSRRAEVAHTIAFRRRKGTAPMLEQLARDVTGRHARVVEFFKLLATTQYVNHLRPDNLAMASLRDGNALDWFGSAFDPLPRTLDVRRIASRRGRYNIPNIGIFLWRVDAHRLRDVPLTPDPTDATGLRFRISPLGNDIPLHTRPETEEEISHLAEPINVPARISRRLLHARTAAYYGEGRSLAISVGGTARPVEDIVACDLSDAGGAWAHDAPSTKIAVDPELGRIAFASDLTPAPTDVSVTFHYGALGDLGGGEYPRSSSFEAPIGGFRRVPDDDPTIQDALDALAGAGVVEITDSGTYAEALSIVAAADAGVELRAAEGMRPTVELTAPMAIGGAPGSSVIVNGLVLWGAPIEVAATTDLRRLRLAHMTAVPGIALAADGTAIQPGAPSLVVRRPGTEVRIEDSIVGAIHIHPDASAAAFDGIIDAGDATAIAYEAPDGASPPPGGSLDLESVTVIGRVRTTRLSASDSILLGRAEVERRQEGCLRFSFAPLDSTVPQRYQCQPGTGDAAANIPHFTSLRYATPAYCQIADRTPEAITRGAEDESEMGAYRHLYQPQGEIDLRTRLDEYLRVGLQAGVFHES